MIRPFLVRPSFIITIVIKRYKERTIVFASVSVCRSVCPHRRTYPNLVDLYIKLKGLFTRNTKMVVQILSRKP
jgi:hypothetical protein